MKKMAAEFIGTFTLVLIGCGAAVLAGDQVGQLGIAFAFGLAIVAMAYGIGPVSGCHDFRMQRENNQIQTSQWKYFTIPKDPKLRMDSRGKRCFVLTAVREQTDTTVSASSDTFCTVLSPEIAPPAPTAEDDDNWRKRDVLMRRLQISQGAIPYSGRLEIRSAVVRKIVVPHDVHANDLEVTYSFDCSAPSRLRAISVTGFDAFPAIENIDAVFLANAQQEAQRLRRGSRMLKLD